MACLIRQKWRPKRQDSTACIQGVERVIIPALFWRCDANCSKNSRAADFFQPRPDSVKDSEGVDLKRELWHLASLYCATEVILFGKQWSSRPCGPRPTDQLSQSKGGASRDRRAKQKDILYYIGTKKYLGWSTSLHCAY